MIKGYNNNWHKAGVISQDDLGTGQLDQSKKCYNPPKIDCIGPISKFTQSGTGVTTEMATGQTCKTDPAAMSCI